MFNTYLFNGSFCCNNNSQCDPNEIAEKVWAYLLQDHNTPNSFGSLLKEIANNIDNSEILV